MTIYSWDLYRLFFELAEIYTMELIVEKFDRDDVAILNLCGALNGKTSKVLVHHLRQEVKKGQLGFILDCSSLNSFDGTAQQKLSVEVQRLRAGGGDLALCRLSDEIRGRISSRLKYATIHSTRYAALQWLSKRLYSSRVAKLAASLLLKGKSNATINIAGRSHFDRRRLNLAARLLGLDPGARD